MENFEKLLASSAEAHGNICPGQVLGVRMSMLGCRLIGLDTPTNRQQNKKLLVYVEIDRCAADAIAHVTGARLGKRSLKFVDYGIMAASFLNLETKVAFRVVSTEKARALAPFYAPEIPGKYPQQLEAYKRMPDSVLFRVEKVGIEVGDFNFPGPARRKISCARCGQVVRDRREVIVDGVPLCVPCSGKAYFRDAHEVTWERMDWSPDQPSPECRVKETVSIAREKPDAEKQYL